RKTESAFGNKGVTLYHLVRNSHPVILGLIISGKNPYFSFKLYPYLRRSYDMTGGVKGKFNPVYCKSLIPVFPCNLNIPQSMFNYGNIGVMGDVFFMAPAGMVGMSVSDNGIFYRPPGIKIHIGLCAVNTILIECQ